MVKIFNWLIISSDEYFKQVEDTDNAMATMSDEITELKGRLKDSEKHKAKLLKDLCTAEAERDQAQEDLHNLQSKAFIRGEKGRFVKYLKSIAIADEKNSAN